MEKFAWKVLVPSSKRMSRLDKGHRTVTQHFNNNAYSAKCERALSEIVQLLDEHRRRLLTIYHEENPASTTCASSTNRLKQPFHNKHFYSLYQINQQTNMSHIDKMSLFMGQPTFLSSGTDRTTAKSGATLDQWTRCRTIDTHLHSDSDQSCQLTSDT